MNKILYRVLPAAAALCLAAGGVQAQVTSGLVVHLPFEDNYNNTVNNDATATAVGTPTFGAGQIGKAVFLSTAADGSVFNYVTLSPSTLLNLGGLTEGTATDFTIAFWCSFTNQTSDPALVSNKDWGSSNNQGWGIFAQGGGNLRINITDDQGAAGKQNTTATPSIRDGKWHHVVLSVVRSGSASIFVDGQLATTSSMDPVKNSIDSSYPINIGQDGTGQYTDGGSAALDILIDDFGIWRRAITAGEAGAIYTFGLGGTNLTLVPSAPPAVDSITPPAGVREPNVVSSSIKVVLSDGNVGINDSSIQLKIDGAAVQAEKVRTDKSVAVSYSDQKLHFPSEKHTGEITFQDKAGATHSKAWTFYGWKNVVLPAPAIFDNFDSLTEFQLPAGWTQTNFTDTATEGEDPDNLNSDTYKAWVLASRDRLAGLKSRIFDTVAPGQSSNGVAITTENLSGGNVLYAESDVRGGNQVQFLYTKPFNLSGMTNVALAFASLYEQNQDSLGAVEYSIDGGKTWLPVVYYLDGVDIITAADGTVDAVATLTTARDDSAVWTDENGQAKGGKYGDGIAAPVSAALGPFIVPRVDDDPTEGKRYEIFRLAQAGGKSDVRLRFAQTGTGSWYFGVDNLGFYEVAGTAAPTQPVMSISRGSNGITLSWTGSGSLLEATGVAGPWTPAASQANPQTVTPSAAQKFYRVGP